MEKKKPTLDLGGLGRLGVAICSIAYFVYTTIISQSAPLFHREGTKK